MSKKDFFLPRPSANDLVSDFVQAGALKEMTGQSRNRVFVLDEYLKLFRI